MSAQFSSTIETINPTIAEQYLARNVKNRPKKARAIERYARDMAAGKWGLTGEAIKFDTNGNLIDGQNRLSAVVESGSTIQTVVQRGLEPETQGIMDNSVPRSGGDQLALNGFNSGRNLQAVCNAHRAYHSGLFKHVMSRSSGATRMTNTELLEYAENHPRLTEALQAAGRLRSSLMLNLGSIAVAYDVLSKIDADAAHDFFSRITDLRTSGHGDPVASLIKRVAAERSAGRRPEVAFGLYLIFRAWNAYRDGEQLTKFQIGSDDKGWAAIPTPH